MHDLERYNFREVEDKWQNLWTTKKNFPRLKIKIKKILLFGNVSLSFRKNSHGSRKKLYNR